MALTSPDSRCRVSDPAKHALSLEESDEEAAEEVDEYPDAENFAFPYSSDEQVFNGVSEDLEVVLEQV